MSIPESVMREIERAIQAAEFPRGMSVHDGKAKVHSSHLRRLLAELATLRDKALQFDLDQAGIARREAEATELIELRAELAALRAERGKLLGCRDDLREIAEAINDPRIHNTMTIAEWCREVSRLTTPPSDLSLIGR